MTIVHVVQFGANKSGLYEAARDMMRADFLSGHEVYCVDRGFNRPNGVEYSPIGSVDDRAGFQVITSNPSILHSADVIIDHGGIPDSWIKDTNAPIIAITHARPLDSFGVEYWTNSKTYSMEKLIGTIDRYKKIIYFWPEFKPFWDNVYPEGKSIALEYPTMDEKRFFPGGPRHIIEEKHKGIINILICDSWNRRDIDMFEIINGVILAAKQNNKIKLHFYGVEAPEGKIKPCWEILIQKMYDIGCMGELCGRMTNMDQVYRSMDVVLTPHRIITRVIGESILCGTPVIASNGCKLAQFHCDPHDPYSVAKAIEDFINSNRYHIDKDIKNKAKKLYLKNYSTAMNPIYEEITRGK